MSEVTHSKCSHRDAEMEERIFEAHSFSLAANHPTIHPLAVKDMRRRKMLDLRHLNEIRIPIISGARSPRVAEKRSDRNRVAKYHTLTAS